MSSVQTTITQLPQAGPILGTESVPIVQGGQTRQTTTGAIAAANLSTQTFLTVNQEPTLANSQYLAAGTGLGLVDGGAQSYLRIVLNGAAASLETALDGFMVKTAINTLTPRVIQVTGDGIDITDGDGQAGNPVINLSGLPASLAGMSGSGLVTVLSGTTLTPRSIAGTANEIDVANGNAFAGNPTIGLADNVVLPGTGSVTIPVGTTAQQPAGSIGQLRYDSTADAFYGFSNGAWRQFSTSGGVTSVGTGNGLTGGPITSTGTISIDTSIVATLSGSQTLTNKTISGSSNTFSDIGNSSLTNYQVTFNGSTVALGGSATITASTTNALTIGTGLSGTSFNGSTPVTISITNLGLANGVATLDSGGTVPLSQIPASIQGGLIYQGTWNASTNTPTLTSGVGTKGYYYAVSVAGTTNLDGITDWNAGDLAVFNGTVWEQIDNTDAVTSVNGYTGTVVLTASDIGGLGTMAVQNATSVAITGGSIDGAAIGGTTPAAGTFTDVAIPTATGESTLLENTTITGWIYSGTSFSISAQEATPSGLFFGSNGTKMYVNGSSGDDVNEYTLGTAWNITTATFVTVFSTAAQDSAPADIFFKPDGLTMFVLGDTNNTVYQYTLGTAWSVATASYASKSFSVGTQEGSPAGLWFKPDGTTMYVVGSSLDTVFQYTLGTAWDISTASYASKSYSVAAQEGTPNQVNLSDDGTKMWVTGIAGDDIWEYALGTAWDVSTATPVNNVYVGFQDTNPTGMFIDSSAVNRVFMVGQTSDTVYQYNTATNSLEIDTEKLYVDGAVSVNGNFVAGSNAYVDGTLTVQGNSNLGGTSTINAITVANNSTLVSATSTSSLNLSSGATTSGSTKTVNIGTAGASGSTTNINIGSAVSGSLGTTTIQAPTVNIGQLVTQFQVTNTASAVNYVRAVGSVTGAGPTLSAQGTDTNIDFNVAGKGSGQFKTTSVAVIGANAALSGAVNPIVAMTGTANGYIQSYIYNANTGISASADFTAYANNSTDAHGWADVGFTSSTYADPVYTVTGPNEAYLFGSALNSTYTGNLVYATDSTGSANAHQWYVGGFTQAKGSWKMQLTSTGLTTAGAVTAIGGISGGVF